MEGLDPDFAKKVRPGDVIVAGTSAAASREQASSALREAGVACVAKSLLDILSKRHQRRPAGGGGRRRRPSGEVVEVDLSAGKVTVGGATYLGTRLPEFLLAILQDGGLVPTGDGRWKGRRMGRRKERLDIP